MSPYWFFTGLAFLLFDVCGANGEVNENVFAYANRVGSDRTLVLYNNAYEQASGWITQSAGFVEKQADSNKALRYQSIAAALGASGKPGRFVVFREQRSGLWFIRESRDLHGGLYIALYTDFACC